MTSAVGKRPGTMNRAEMPAGRSVDSAFAQRVSKGDVAAVRAQLAGGEVSEDTVRWGAWQAGLNNQDELVRLFNEVRGSASVRGRMVAGAAEGGHWALVESLVQEGEISSEGWTELLMAAVSAGQNHLVREAISHNIWQAQLDSAFIAAVQARNWQAYEIILERYPEERPISSEPVLVGLFAQGPLDAQRRRIVEQIVRGPGFDHGPNLAMVGKEASRQQLDELLAFVAQRMRHSDRDTLLADAITSGRSHFDIAEASRQTAPERLARARTRIDLIYPEERPIQNRTLSQLSPLAQSAILRGAIEANLVELIEDWISEGSLDAQVWRRAFIYAVSDRRPGRVIGTDDIGLSDCGRALLRAALQSDRREILFTSQDEGEQSALRRWRREGEGAGLMVAPAPQRLLPPQAVNQTPASEPSGSGQTQQQTASQSGQRDVPVTVHKTEQAVVGERHTEGEALSGAAEPVPLPQPQGRHTSQRGSSLGLLIIVAGLVVLGVLLAKYRVRS